MVPIAVKAHLRHATPQTLDAEAEKPNVGLLERKRLLILIVDTMIGSTSPRMDFTASWTGDDIFLVDKLVDVATVLKGGQLPWLL